MRPVVIAERKTAAEYLAEDWERRTELVAGEIVVHEPLWDHDLVCSNIHFALSLWTRAAPRRGAAALPLDVLVSEHDVYAPDVVWYRDGRVPRRGDPRPYAVPDLVVEARSPSTWRFDIGAKKAAYERAGLSELWLVDTSADVVLVFRRSPPRAEFDLTLELAAGDTLASPLLPGFALAVDAVFAEPAGHS